MGRMYQCRGINARLILKELPLEPVFRKISSSNKET
jgi:hypothetical protein